MNIAEQMAKVARDARSAAQVVAGLSTAVKNDPLRRMAQALLERSEELLAANEQDLSNAWPRTTVWIPPACS